jgi:hypothetical protein
MPIRALAVLEQVAQVGFELVGLLAGECGLDGLSESPSPR